MPKGGRRAGAGRKPGSTSKISRRGVVLGMDGQRREAFALPPALTAPTGTAASDALIEAPDSLGLSVDAQSAWRHLAPYALQERTLIRSRVPGFGKLCEEWAYCAAFEKRIHEIGVVTAEADRLLKRLNDYKKLLKGSLGDFNLKSFGKPAAPEKMQATSNAFAVFGAKA